MSSDSNRLRFHMGCGERLQSRRWIVRCISGAQLRTRVKPGTDRAKHEKSRREEDRDES
jgi:hypothetical protein